MADRSAMTAKARKNPGRMPPKTMRMPMGLPPCSSGKSGDKHEFPGALISIASHLYLMMIIILYIVKETSKTAYFYLGKSAL
jgi:hypothetical protein